MLIIFLPKFPIQIFVSYLDLSSEPGTVNLAACLTSACGGPTVISISISKLELNSTSPSLPCPHHPIPCPASKHADSSAAPPEFTFLCVCGRGGGGGAIHPQPRLPEHHLPNASHQRSLGHHHRSLDFYNSAPSLDPFTTPQLECVRPF